MKLNANESCAPSRAKPYRAPPWLWASVDFYETQSPRSPILYQHNIHEKFEPFPRLIVRHMETQLAGRDSVRYGETGFIKRDRYGAVSSGPLRIRCVLVEARVVLYPRRNSENVRRHTVQFSEEGPLDQNCPPGFSPNLHLDISSKEPSQRPLISDPISTDAMDLDMVFDTLSLTKEGSIDREEDMCQGSKVWMCVVGRIADGGICAFALRELGKRIFPRFERVGYLYNEVAQLGEEFSWNNNFMRRLNKSKETAIEIL